MNPKIDLTENRDFRKESYLTSIHLVPLVGENMTLEQYNSLKRHESIFGKRGHDNRTFEIFGITGITDLIRDRECHCDRCGKELRIPWKRPNSGLCQECEDILDRKYNNVNPIFSNISSGRGRDPFDIFNLR